MSSRFALLAAGALLGAAPAGAQTLPVVTPRAELVITRSVRVAPGVYRLAAPASHKSDPLGERLLAYIAFTRPSHSLTISCAAVTEEGAERLPSSLLAEVRQALPELQAVAPAETDPPASCTIKMPAAISHGFSENSQYPSSRPHAT